jgi:hypothetical protein
MATIKIFLASSAELQPDRQAFEQLLYRRSKLWQNRGLFFELVVWEDFIDKVSDTRLQDDYNKAIRECDIFVMLFWTKVGKYTEEEFDVAYKAFKDKGKPIIYTYFKDAPPATTKEKSLDDFTKKLTGDLQHYKTVYKNTEGLLLHFWIQLDKLYELNTPAAAPQVIQKTSRQELKDLINQDDFSTAFEKMNEYFLNNNDKLNTLIFEFVSQPNNFNLVMFRMRLRTFIDQNWK